MMNQLSITILSCLVQVTVLCAIGSLLYLAVRRLEPGLGRLCIAALMVLVTCLSLMAWTPWPNWSGFVARSTSSRNATVPVTNDAVRSTVDQAVGTSASASQHVLLESTFWSTFWQEFNDPTQSAVRSQSDAARSPRRWPDVLVVVAGVVLTVASIRFAVACFAVLRWRRQSDMLTDELLKKTLRRLQRAMQLPRDIAAAETPHINSAATIGWRRPMILLPTHWRQWPQQELEATLAHEFAHIAAKDWPMWLIAQIAVTLHFYHPLVHWLARRLRLEQELAADATAAAVTGSKEDYLGSLASQMLRADKARLSWAAQTFLPTRSTIVRRIEMLKEKSPKLLTGRRSGAARVVVIGSLLALGLLVAGVRGPTSNDNALRAQDVAGGEQASRNDSPNRDATDAVNEDQRVRGDIQFADENSVLFLRILPNAILAGEENAPLRNQIDELLEKGENPFGMVRLAELHSVAIIPYQIGTRNPQTRTVLRFNKPLDQTSIAMAWQNLRALHTVNGVQVYSNPDEPEGISLVKFPNGVVIDTNFAGLKSLLVRQQIRAHGAPFWVRQEAIADASAQLFLTVNMHFLKTQLPPADSANGSEDLPLALVKPLIDHPTHAAIAGDLSPRVDLSGFVACKDETNARRVSDTLIALRTLAGNMLAQQSQHADARGSDAPRQNQIIQQTAELGASLLESVKIDSEGATVRVQMGGEKVASPMIQAAILLPAIQSARQAAMRTQSINNLRHIALAMHNFHEAHGHFPPPVLTGPDGTTKHSWRVAILPYIEQQALYESYRKNEPWDSEHNRRILESMPPVFRSPTEPGGKFNSAYYVLVGDETVFPDNGKGTKIFEIKDGTSKTFMVVEAKRDIPWTKPEDIPFSPAHEFPKLGGYFDGIFLAAFCDGAVHAISKETDKKGLSTLITRSDGEPTPRNYLQPR